MANVGFTTLSNVAAFNSQGADLKFVFDLTQKPVARWCALASRTDIKTPKDLSGKTFVSFGSAEQTAVVRQMIDQVRWRHRRHQDRDGRHQHLRDADQRQG